MGHRLSALKRAFSFHYSGPTRSRAAFAKELARVPWSANVELHVSDEGTRLDLEKTFAGIAPEAHIYTCGRSAYMSAVMEAAARHGVSEEHRHLEYFAVPETPEHQNHPFKVMLAC